MKPARIHLATSGWCYAHWKAPFYPADPSDDRQMLECYTRRFRSVELEDANPFRVRAYRNASRTVGSHSRRMVDMIRQGEDLSRLPGIGKDLAGKIGTLVQTGRLPRLERVESRMPAELRELMKVEGLGPKRQME